MAKHSMDPGFGLTRSSAPLHRQIYDHFRMVITAGQLRPGDRLPSARGLARQLTIARGTVDAAYAMLAGEGYVLGRRPSGTIVCPELPRSIVRRSSTKPLQPPIAKLDASPDPKPFQLGLPALDAFPRKLWSRLAAREARAFAAVDMAYPDRSGYRPLREAIAAYLAVARGILCDARQVVITPGHQGALDLIGRTLLKRKQVVLFEDPCYPPARRALATSGATLLPVRVDAEGFRVEDGVARAPGARLAVVTPSHQSPLGVALSLPRRLALLSWASEARAFIVEDDYDGEFHYVGRPLPALKSLDRSDRVLYAGSYSKVLFPGLRLGYLVLPEQLVGPFADTLRNRGAGISTFEQRVVAAFMAEGYFARHLKRMRDLYANRRQALADALVIALGDRIAVDLTSGGMHLIVRWSSRARDTEVARKAQEAGLAVEALSRRAIKYTCGDGLLLGFTTIAEKDAASMCRLLERAIGEDLAN